MSTCVPKYSPTASGTVNGGRFVTQTGTDFVVSQSATGEIPIGVSQRGTKNSTVTYYAADGDPVAVFLSGQIAYLQCGGSVNAGDRLKPDANGKAITASSGPSGAVALQDGSDGAYIQVNVKQDNA